MKAAPSYGTGVVRYYSSTRASSVRWLTALAKNSRKTILLGLLASIMLGAKVRAMKTCPGSASQQSSTKSGTRVGGGSFNEGICDASRGASTLA